MYYVYINEKENGTFDIEFHEGINGVAQGAAAIFEFDSILSAKRHIKMLKTYDSEMLKKVIAKQKGEHILNKKRNCLKKKEKNEFEQLDDILGR